MADMNFDFDELQIYMGRDYKVNEYITLKQPTVGQICDFGERRYFNTVSMLTSIPSDMKSQLDDMGIDYVTLPDYQLFIMLTRLLKAEDTSLLLNNLDLSAFEVGQNSTNGKLELRGPNGEIIDELAYLRIANYLRKVHEIKPKIEKPATKTVRRILIDLDRQKIQKSKDKPYESRLKPMISAMMRYPGFKYNKKELNDCGIYEFLDTVKGAQIYTSSIALLQGSYSGMIDTSKINKEQFNWLRSE